MALSVPYFRWSYVVNICRTFSSVGMDESKTKFNNDYSKLLCKLQHVDIQVLGETEKEIHARHLEACKRLTESYTDPETGYEVMTGYSHLKRGDCCGNECRHCPYDHIHVPQEKKSKSFNSSFYV